MTSVFHAPVPEEQTRRLDDDAFVSLQLPTPVGPYVHQVTEEEVSWFLDATAVPWGATETLRRDLSAGYAPHLLLANDYSMALNVAFRRTDVLPVGARYEFVSPLRVGTTVVTKGSIVDKFEKGTRKFIIAETEVNDVATNKTVMRSRDFMVLWPH